jgi:hypothetical protein
MNVSPNKDRDVLEKAAPAGGSAETNDGEETESVIEAENREEADAGISDTEPGAIDSPVSLSRSSSPESSTSDYGKTEAPGNGQEMAVQDDLVDQLYGADDDEECISGFSDSSDEDDEQDHNRRDGEPDSKDENEVERIPRTLPVPQKPKYPMPTNMQMQKMGKNVVYKKRILTSNMAHLILDHHGRTKEKYAPWNAKRTVQQLLGNMERQDRLGRPRDPKLHETFMQSALSGVPEASMSAQLKTAMKLVKRKSKYESAYARVVRQNNGIKNLLKLKENHYNAIRSDHEKYVRFTEETIGAQRTRLHMAQDQQQLLLKELAVLKDSASAISAEEDIGVGVSKELDKSHHTINQLMENLEKNESLLLTTRIEANQAEKRIRDLEERNEKLQASNQDLLHAFAKREQGILQDSEELKKALEEAASSEDPIEKARRLKAVDAEFVAVDRHNSVVELLHQKNTEFRELNRLFENSVYDLRLASEELELAKTQIDEFAELLDNEKIKCAGLEGQADQAFSRLSVVQDDRNQLYTELETMRETKDNETENQSSDDKIKLLEEELKRYKFAQAAHDSEMEAKNEELTFAHEYCLNIEAQHKARAEKDAATISRLEAFSRSAIERLTKKAEGSVKDSDDMESGLKALEAENMELEKRLAMLKLEGACRKSEEASQEQAARESDFVSEIVMLKVKVAELSTAADSCSVSASTTDDVLISQLEQYHAVQKQRDAAQEELEKTLQELVDQKAANEKLTNAVSVKQKQVVDALKQLEDISTKKVDVDESNMHEVARQLEGLQNLVQVFKEEIKRDILAASQVRPEELPPTLYELLVVYLEDQVEQQKALSGQVAHYRELARGVDAKHRFAANRELELQQLLAAVGRNRDWFVDGVKAMVRARAAPAAPATPVVGAARKQLLGMSTVNSWLDSIRPSPKKVEAPQKTAAAKDDLAETADEGGMEIDSSWVADHLSDSDHQSSSSSEHLAQRIACGTDDSSLASHLDD